MSRRVATGDPASARLAKEVDKGPALDNGRSDSEMKFGFRGRGPWWAWLVVVVLCLGLLGLGIAHSDFLDVDEVRISGVGNDVDLGLTAAELLAATRIEIGSPMIRQDLEAVVQRVTALAWVADADVYRDWPGTLVLEVRQRIPLTNAVDPSSAVVLLDAYGTVLERRKSVVERLPVVRVERHRPPGERMVGLGPLLRAAESITTELSPWIVALVPSAGGVVAELPGGVEVFLGMGEDYKDEIRSLTTILKRVELACIIEIDVSVHESPVVRRDEVRCG